MMRDGEDGNIDAMFDKVGDALGELVDSFQQLDSTCKFSCENGQKPVPRKDHKPTTNGCGSYGFEVDTSNLPLMTKCCDEHDYCYDRCNSDKAKCDKVFRKCLLEMCNTMEYALSDEEFEGCKATADMVHTGTEMLGCKAYKKAQSEACDCGEVKKLPPASPDTEPSKAKRRPKQMTKISNDESRSEKSKNTEQTDTRPSKISKEKTTQSSSETKAKTAERPKKTVNEKKTNVKSTLKEEL
ncbi:hypothetical protein FSP39_023605 [Pinctada imbricata]|uniref:Group XIIA secretory phospholipase A2 n=1 Tax=Pinctada imbricata TaxID=66713 RepID=A0AA88XUD2_PINIB|nr:hypothetical protein FSP39_023605 [Pinctada imbricata]